MKKLINYCEICHGILGMHDNLTHLDKIINDIHEEKQKNPEYWVYSFNWPKVNSEFAKYEKI